MADTSYLFGDDEIDGWGQRYFFTFFSEFGDRGNVPYVEAAVLVATLVISVISNLFIIIAVLRYRQLLKLPNYFVVNLAAADLVFALGIPIIAYARITHEWLLGPWVCRILPYTQFVCGFVLLWTLTLISIDRHRCLCVPPYRSPLNAERAGLCCLATWIIAAILFIPVPVWFREQEVYSGQKICTMVFPRSPSINISLAFTLPTVLLAAVLPMATLVHHYYSIFKKIRSLRTRWLSSMSKLPSPNEEQRLSRHVRVVRLLVLNVLLVLSMWTPITLVVGLIYMDGRRENADTHFFLRSHHFIWALQIALLSTIVNPILYGLLSDHFRTCLKKIHSLSKRKKALSRDFLNTDGTLSRSPKPALSTERDGHPRTRADSLASHQILAV
ncbi:free fatty acid receptor 4 [Bemisia tabaci]